MQTAALVLTTINDPCLLEDYYENFRAHGHLGGVTVIVIPDRKTPDTVYRRCHELRARGLRCSAPPLMSRSSFWLGWACPLQRSPTIRITAGISDT